MNNWSYIFAGILVTLIIRILPATLIRRPIENRFIRSFLYYVPYVTLSLMIFPSIIEGQLIPGIFALLIGIIASYKGFDLLTVAIICCTVFYLVSMFL